MKNVCFQPLSDIVSNPGGSSGSTATSGIEAVSALMWRLMQDGYVERWQSLPSPSPAQALKLSVMRREMRHVAREKAARFRENGEYGGRLGIREGLSW